MIRRGMDFPADRNTMLELFALLMLTSKPSGAVHGLRASVTSAFRVISPSPTLTDLAVR